MFVCNESVLKFCNEFETQTAGVFYVTKWTEWKESKKYFVDLFTVILQAEIMKMLILASVLYSLQTNHVHSQIIYIIKVNIFKQFLVIYRFTI